MNETPASISEADLNGISKTEIEKQILLLGDEVDCAAMMGDGRRVAALVARLDWLKFLKWRKENDEKTNSTKDTKAAYVARAKRKA
jgi:hypothetical protein